MATGTASCGPHVTSLARSPPGPHCFMPFLSACCPRRASLPCPQSVGSCRRLPRVLQTESANNWWVGPSLLQPLPNPQTPLIASPLPQPESSHRLQKACAPGSVRTVSFLASPQSCIHSLKLPAQQTFPTDVSRTCTKDLHSERGSIAYVLLL